MLHKRPYILSIAGFDPSAGAGLLADVKTFESLKCYGLSVATCLTVQHESKFLDCHWTSFEIIKNQIELLYSLYPIEYVKIGVVENWEVLDEIVELLILLNPEVKIILDPVLKSSSSFEFHLPDGERLAKILSKIHFITPNYIELQDLYPSLKNGEKIEEIRKHTNLYLKGGHRSESIGKDELFTTEGTHYSLNPKRKKISEKHGSGCVLASALTSYLALGFPILKASFRAKNYTERLLVSNPSLLGFHRL